MKKSWQIKTLLFFLILFLLANIETFILRTIEFIVRIPLNFNSFMANLVGKDIWSNIVITTSNPLLLTITGLILCIIVIGLIRSIDTLRK